MFLRDCGEKGFVEERFLGLRMISNSADPIKDFRDCGRQACQAAPRWLFGGASIKVSATPTNFTPVFRRLPMKRFKVAFVVLAAVAMLSMSLNASRWTARAQKN